jgi:hypothetical protein
VAPNVQPDQLVERPAQRLEGGFDLVQVGGRPVLITNREARRRYDGQVLGGLPGPRGGRTANSGADVPHYDLQQRANATLSHSILPCYRTARLPASTREPLP